MRGVYSRPGKKYAARYPGIRSTFHLATVDLIEARVLHERGLFDEALRMVRQAGHHFALSRDHAAYLHARVIETWMLCADGQSEAASALWTAAVDARTAARTC